MQLVNHGVAPGGVDGWGAVCGPRAASGRSELAGGIAALLSPYPIHLGSDNLGFVKKANSVIAAHPEITRKPWSLQRDGHLWRIFHHLTLQRSPSNTKICWVKGHATADHITKGITTSWKKSGNDRADANVATGTFQAQPAGLQALGRLYADRQNNYVSLLQHIHQVLIQTFLARQHIIKQREERDNPRLLRPHGTPKQAVAVLFYPKPAASLPALSLGPRPLTCPEHGMIKDLYLHVWAFLATLQGHAATPTQPGITWLELAALFVARGGNLTMPHTTAGAAQPRAAILPTLLAFRGTTRLVLRAHANHTTSLLLKPDKTPRHRLQPLAYTTRSPSIHFLPCVTTDEATAINLFVLHFRCCITKRTKASLLSDTLALKPMPLRIRGHVVWEDFFPATEHTSTTIGKHLAITAPSIMPPQIVESSRLQKRIALRCPACRARRSVTYSMLIGPAGWKQVWCPGICKRPYSSNQWTCACSCLWQNCATHAHGNFAPAKRQCVRRVSKHSRARPMCPPCPRAAKPFQHLAQPPPTPTTVLADSPHSPSASSSEAQQHSNKRGKVTHHHNESSNSPSRQEASSYSSPSVARVGATISARLPIGTAAPSSPRSSSISGAFGGLSPSRRGGPAVDARAAHPLSMRPADAQGRAASIGHARLPDATGFRPKRASSYRNSSAAPKAGKRARIDSCLAAVARLREARACPL